MTSRRTLAFCVVALMSMWIGGCFENSTSALKDWESKKPAIVGCCTQNFNAGDFNEKFKTCFRNLVQDWEKAERNARLQAIRRVCQRTIQCMIIQRICVRNQQLSLRFQFLNTTFEKPTDCEDYDSKALALRNRVIAEHPCN